MSDTRATSLIPAVKRLLVERLQQRSALRDAKVEVKYARPLDPKREAIAMGPGSFDRTAGPMRTGRTLRDEEAQFTIWINASKPGQEGEAAEVRAFEILAEIENEIADDPTFGNALAELGVANGLTVQHADVGEVEPNSEGWEGLIRVIVTYSARLT